MTLQTSGVGVRFWTVDKTISTIHKAAPRQKIFIVARTPRQACQLVEGGVTIHELNVGNMHFSEGKRAITKKVYVDDAALADFKAIEEAGVDVYIQDVSGAVKERIRYDV